MLLVHQRDVGGRELGDDGQQLRRRGDEDVGLDAAERLAQGGVGEAVVEGVPAARHDRGLALGELGRVVAGDRDGTLGAYVDEVGDLEAVGQRVVGRVAAARDAEDADAVALAEAEEGVGLLDPGARGAAHPVGVEEDVDDVERPVAARPAHRGAHLPAEPVGQCHVVLSPVRERVATILGGATPADRVTRMPTSSTPLVLVSGSGRSGTSSLAGTLKRLGLHVPQPEVEASETNPRGFYEPQWVIDFHKRHLKELALFNIDSRPAAVDIVARHVETGVPTGELHEWLSGQLAEHDHAGDQIVVKDPHAFWFAQVWEVVSAELGADLRWLTALRHPAEVVGSRDIAYLSSQSEELRLTKETSNVAGWVHAALLTEQAGRGSKRAFVRYVDLLADWRAALAPVQQQLELDFNADLSASPEHRDHHPVDDFIEPSMRKSQLTWDDVRTPDWLRDMAEEVWQLLGVLTTTPHDVDTLARLDDDPRGLPHALRRRRRAHLRPHQGRVDARRAPGARRAAGDRAAAAPRPREGPACARSPPSAAARRPRSSAAPSYAASRAAEPRAQTPVTPSPEPEACSSKFSCSIRWRTGTPSLRRAREVQSTWKNSATTWERVRMMASRASTEVTSAASASTGGSDVTLPWRGAAGVAQRDEGLLEVGGGVLLALAAQRLDVDVVHRQGRRGHQVAGAERAERGLDAGRGVLERQQHVVDDRVLDLGVQRAHLLGVGGREGLLDEEHDVVGALPVVDRVVGDVGVVGHDSPPGSVLRILVRS